MSLKNAIAALVWIAFIFALLFVPAGTLDWPQAWIFLAEFIVGGFVITIWLARHDPGLLKERMRSPIQKEQTPRDKLFMGFIILAWYGWVALMALDARRWQLSHVPRALAVIGAILIAVGFVIVWLTFRENSFAAPVIKIQQQRGQHVIDTGPYGIVRHPMYVGGALYMLGMPLLLGSWLGLIVLPLMLAALTTRIFIEEDTLRTGLRGYDEYTKRVHYRIIPGIW